MAALSRVPGVLAKALVSRPFLTAALLTCCTVLTLWGIFRPAFLTSSTRFADLAPDYTPQVDDLLQGWGFQSFRYPPLFPLILAGIERISLVVGIDDGLLGALLLLALAVGGSLLILALGDHIWGPPWGLPCVVLWLAYPVFWRLWLQPLSEPPFMMLLLASVWATLVLLEASTRREWLAMALGVALGLAMLTRPSGIGLPVVFGTFLWASSRDWEGGQRKLIVALPIIAAALSVAPWELYAWRATGRVIPLSTGGIPTMLDGLTYAVDPSENRSVWVPESVRDLQLEIYEKSYKELNDLGTIAAFLAVKARTEPGAIVQMFTIKAARSWYGTDSSTHDRGLLLLQIPVLALVGGTMVRAVKLRGRAAIAGVLTIVLTAYFWVVTTAMLSIIRYLVPALALMVVLVPALFPDDVRDAFTR